MTRLARLAGLLLALPLLGACTYRTIFFTPPEGSIIVGPVAVSRGGNSDEALSELALLAAQNGADLIVRLRMQQVQNAVAVSGLAVRAPAAPVAIRAPAVAPATPPAPAPTTPPTQQPAPSGDSGALD